MQQNDTILQIKVQAAGAEIVKTDRAGFVRETSQGGAIVSYLLMNALDGSIQKSRTIALPPDPETTSK